MVTDIMQQIQDFVGDLDDDAKKRFFEATAPKKKGKKKAADTTEAQQAAEVDVTSILQRIDELELMLEDDTLSEEQRAEIENELDDLREQVPNEAPAMEDEEEAITE